MSELDEELGNPEEQVESLEEALARNLAAGSEEDTTAGDEPSSEVEASEVQESEDALEPLEKWSDDVKERFSKLDRETQQFLLDREKDVERHLTEKTQGISEKQKQYERLDKVLDPFRQELDKRGIDLTPHLGQALQAYFSYHQNPVGTIKALIQSAGLSQDQFFEDEDVDPTIRALRAEISNLKQQVASVGNRTSEEGVETARREYNAFKEAKDDQGNLAHPYFEQVQELMAPLVQAGKSLDEAYQEVVWTLPDYRKAQMEAQRKAEQKEAQKKQAEKVKKSRSAETLPSSDADKGSSQKSFTSWSDALAETLNQLSH